MMYNKQRNKEKKNKILSRCSWHYSHYGRSVACDMWHAFEAERKKNYRQKQQLNK